MATIPTPTRASVGFVRSFLRYDWWLVLIAGCLMLVGAMSLYSIDFSTGSHHLQRQVFRGFIGFGPLLIMLLVRPDAWRKFAAPLYVFNLVVLALVLVAGKTGGGAQRWLQIGPLDFQPSEMAKLLITITLATFYANRLDEITKLRTFLLGFAHVAIPMALIYEQPHLGATLVVLAMWLTVSLVAGVPVRSIVVAIVLGIGALAVAFTVPGILDDYQRDRVLGLFSPDPKGSGYHVRKSEISFGVGGFSGVGYLKGEQKAGSYVPEQETDFVFTVLGEEGGFAGCLLVLAGFAALFARLWWILYQSRSKYHQMLIGGVLAILSFHTFANLGMIMRLLPVVGLWLPFLSYGGTALWLCMACIGLALNVKHREDDQSLFSNQIV